MGDFPQDYCVAGQTNGGSGGSGFSFYVNGGKAETVLLDGTQVESYYAISKITTWVAEHRMVGIQIWLSNSPAGYSGDNPTHFYGATGGAAKSYVFQPGELITSLKIYKSKYNDKTYCGGVSFTTSLGGNYSNTNPSGGSSTTMDVGYGLCVGIFGKSGEAIDNLGFWMVSNPYAVALSNVTYIDSPPPPARNVIFQENLSNGGTEPSTFTYHHSFSVETQENWSVSTGTEISASVTVGISAEVYSVTASAELSASWTQTQEETKGTVYTTSETQEVTVEYTLDAGSHYVFTVYDYQGSYVALNYTGFYTLSLPNNVALSYCGKGQSTGQSNSEVFTELVPA